MRRWLAALSLTATLAADHATAEQMTISLSTSEIRIDSTFAGDMVTLFGVITRDAATVSRPEDYEIAVLFRGPPETVVERRKDRIAFLWINNASETIIDAPSVYALDTSGDLTEISTGPLLARYELGFENIRLTYQNHAQANDPRAEEFREAFIRLKQDAGLYTEQFAGVSFIGGTDNVFQSAMWVPANAPDGRYTIDVYLFSGNALLAHEQGEVQIVKVGLEQFMFAASQEHALLYGLACVVLALFIGWLGGLIFRRD
ncbi:TIGR02186 family protein [Bauldia sp.]|uniref:TIGR02186 family protein n=1 Tax=Bauldia sp. TaxID=2575872 RepID=UPI003BAD64D7